MVIASKPGAGIHHLIPFVHIFYYLSVLNINKMHFNESIRRQLFYSIAACAILALFASTTLKVYHKQFSFIKNIIRDSHRDVGGDIENILKTYPGARVSMGYGVLDLENYSLTFYRPILLFQGHPCLIDAASLMDFRKSGIGIPPETIKAISSCYIEIWLIPKNTEPFTMESYYRDENNKTVKLFSNEFQEAFHGNYKLINQTRYFDIYSCKSYNNFK